MAYLPLRNFKYDSGPKRIQSGPDHEAFVVLQSGVQSVGADNGVIVDGTPLSGTTGSSQRWSYDSEWRYVPISVSPELALDASIYTPSGVLSTSEYTRSSSVITAAGVKIVSSIEPIDTFRNTAYQKNVYYGGAAPDNQFYSPHYTPESNTAAEGITGGGVTHQLYESPLLTNILGNQATSSTANWLYNQPVYCKTYTEAVRPTTPGLMSSVVRSIYRGSAVGYINNYGGNLLSVIGGYEPSSDISFDPDDLVIDVPNGTTDSGDTLTSPTICEGGTTIWWTYDVDTGELVEQVGTGDTLALTDAMAGYEIVAEVTCPGSSSSYFTPPVGPVFNPVTAFKYVRVRYDRGIYPRSARPNPPYPETHDLRTSPFFQMSGLAFGDNLSYIHVASNPGNSCTMSPRVGGPWAINSHRVTLNMCSISPVSFMQFIGSYKRYEDGNTGFIGLELLDLYQTTSGIQGELVVTVTGSFEFSNNGSTVLYSWRGLPPVRY